MNSERWQRIEQVFHEALQLEAEARLSYLAQSCSEDSSLREEVESLIDSLERDGSFLVQPAFDRGLRILARRPARLPTYRIPTSPRSMKLAGPGSSISSPWNSLMA